MANIMMSKIGDPQYMYTMFYHSSGPYGHHVTMPFNHKSYQSHPSHCPIPKLQQNQVAEAHRVSLW
jgi:hypothetical protein